MKKRSWYFTLAGSFLLSVLAFVTIYYGGIFGCGGGSNPNGNQGANSFTNGGVTLNASIASSSNSKTVTVTDANGNTLLTLVITTTSATLTFPGVSGSTVINFRTPLSSLPTDYTAARMAVYVQGMINTNPDASVLPDNPGCDWFPDTQCTLGCCADHDKCYHDNNCGASSWIPFVGSDACKNCNSVAYDCIGAACVGVTESFLPNNCYDHRCPVGGTHYDCPPNFDNCTCQDPCPGAPTTCGNGICDAGETATNCNADCNAGNSPSDCCVTTNDCPGETGHNCGSGCCCCGSGLACGSNGSISHICVATP